MTGMPTLRAVSDLHVGHRGNSGIIDEIRPCHPGDWLIVAGDVAEKADQVVDALERLAGRFERVLWVPGNHELWIGRDDEGITSTTKYDRLVDACRTIGVDTPEDPYPVFGDVTVAALFTLYDYSFRPAALAGLPPAQALAAADTARATLDDVLRIAPYVDIPAWCRERVAYSEARLDEVTGPTLLVNHWPLVIEPTRSMRHQEMALWCGTTLTRDFPHRYRAVAAVHGHLHLPREIRVEGVPHVDVSLGYPFEQAHQPPRAWPLPGLRIP